METNTVLRWLTAYSLLAVIGCQAQTAPPTSVPTSPPPIPTSPPTSPPVVTSSRVDVLNQANAAFASGDYASASGFYERAINTPPTGEPAQTTAAINEFARFRDAVSLLEQGDEDGARAQVDALQQQDASAPLARLAAQYWDQYGMIGDGRGACAQIQPQIASEAGPTLAVLQTLGVSVDPARLCR